VIVPDDCEIKDRRDKRTVRSLVSLQSYLSLPSLCFLLVAKPCRSDLGLGL
jgi:hypothetical protein